DLELTWSAPIDPGSVEGRVELRELGGSVVPVEVVMDGDRAARVHPAHSLRFWGDYTLSVGDGIGAADGTACTPAASAVTTIVPTPAPRSLHAASVNGLALVGGHAIAASDGYRGLQTYDLSKPDAITVESDLVTERSPVGLAALGTRAYAPARHASLLV